MSLQAHLHRCTELTPATIERFASVIDPGWITEALQATGKASVRRRLLPAEQVVWLVIGLALFRNEPIWHVVKQLNLALPSVSGLPAASASVQARQRLGDAPLACLFKRLAKHWGTRTAPAVSPPLRVLAVDGARYAAESGRVWRGRVATWLRCMASGTRRVPDGYRPPFAAGYGIW